MRSPIRRTALGAATVVVVASLATAVPAAAEDGGHHHRHRGHSHSATLVEGDLVGSLTTDPVLFGIRPGGADWTVGRSTAEVRTDGRVDVKVRDLVLTATGVNPVAQISASLACNGAVVDTVGPVAYSTDGDARIKDRFEVPARCLAPAVLLNPGVNDKVYIAASGAAR